MKRICVFCGSNPGRRPEYTEAAALAGRAIARAGLGLVYGGGRVGLMGTLADAALAESGEVIGVIPEALAARELAHQGVTELHVVDSMHRRKALMADLADAFVALPGGIGTMEELFEVVTWAQLGLHRKPCALLNVAGYYDHLLALIDQFVAEQFLRPQHRALFIEESDPDTLIERLTAYVPPALDQWITREET